MTQIVSHFLEVITRRRRTLLSNTTTARSIDQHSVSERIAMAAIDYGYVETADAFVRRTSSQGSINLPRRK